MPGANLSVSRPKCTYPVPVKEVPDYFMDHEGKKLLMLGPGELSDDPQGYLLTGLTADDKGRNRGRSLEADFDVPHLLTAISFPQVLFLNNIEVL